MPFCFSQAKQNLSVSLQIDVGSPCLCSVFTEDRSVLRQKLCMRSLVLELRSQTCFSRKWYCADVPIQLLDQGWLGSHPSSVCKRQVNMLGLQCEFFWSGLLAHMHFSWQFCRDQHFPHLLRYDVCWLITGLFVCLLVWKGRSLYFLDGNVTIQRYAICFLF